ncbi:MAG TPA: hypothetical protein VFO62_10725 [Candidatus Binatia bacterium]|nr:hypothetical protein [Candidatus Binatia bacterium]
MTTPWQKAVQRANPAHAYQRDLSFRARDLADWEEYKIERAAICEYLGGLSREAADRAALIMAGPPPRDWQQHGLLDERPGGGQ